MVAQVVSFEVDATYAKPPEAELAQAVEHSNQARNVTKRAMEKVGS